MSLREDITHSIVRLIETGAARGASSPLWDAAVSRGLPINYATRQPYSGVNVPLLWGAAEERGVERNEWLTFKQAEALGANVRKGAKGVLCAFYKRAAVGDDSSEVAEVAGSRVVSILKPFWLFNVADVQGLRPAAPTALPFDPIASAEQLLANSGVPVTWEGSKAFYRTATDEIFMPARERFSTPVNAYAVALHELTHNAASRVMPN